MAAPRRSTRIRNLDLGLTAESDESAHIETRTSKRPRVLAEDGGQDEPTNMKKNKTSGIKKLPVKGKMKARVNEVATKPVASHGTPQEEPNALTRLPAEVLQPILESVDHPPSMVKLASTSKTLYSLVMPILHKRVSVSVHFWAHIPHVIRQLEPHLSIAQKRQLKREGKYKGQQERFSSLLDPLVVPACADDVREMVIGSVDPGKKHKPIVLRYLEEVLKNVHNLEVLDTMELTESMTQSIASKKSLKALRLYGTDDWATSTDISSLAEIGGLEHISITNRNFGGALVSSKEKVLQSILLNSLTTLKSLEVQTSKYYSNFLADWLDQIKSRNPEATQNAHDFTALKSLSLWGIQFMGQFCGNVLPSLTRAIDFVRLRELTLMDLEEGKVTFFKHLEDEFRTAEQGTVQLRKLKVQMKGAEGDRHAAVEYQLEGIYRFISSFDTLTSLEILEYNRYLEGVEQNPGLSRRLLQVIMNHKSLETLRFSYGGVYRDHKPPYISAATVELITKKLPLLRIFEFAPAEISLKDTARALALGKNLETVVFSAFRRDHEYPEDCHPYVSVASWLVDALLEAATTKGDFRWENCYKLRRIEIDSYKFAIGSNLKQQSDLVKLPLKIVKGDLAVMLQELRKKGDSTHYYTAYSTWMDKIAKTTY
ncbi:hypothetical protein FHETE_1133 [Fusarium heterosporum]|uniref:F-box domain-containing protein n=1 Tax=Fusarium heterosporum TaxID=42747 RepID=A0A8H5WWY5_FUSHE|nr:hypothetical protein FHETE_1133 [Fusarium heterosporum]